MPLPSSTAPQRIVDPCSEDSSHVSTHWRQSNSVSLNSTSFRIKASGGSSRRLAPAVDRRLQRLLSIEIVANFRVAQPDDQAVFRQSEGRPLRQQRRDLLAHQIDAG